MCLTEQLASTIFDESRAMFEMCESTVSSMLSSLAHINKSYCCYLYLPDNLYCVGGDVKPCSIQYCCYQVSRRHCHERQRDEHDL